MKVVVVVAAAAAIVGAVVVILVVVVVFMSTVVFLFTQSICKHKIDVWRALTAVLPSSSTYRINGNIYG